MGRDERRVRMLVSNQAGISDRQLDSRDSFSNALGIDSIGIVELIIAIEEDFEIDILDDDAVRMDSVVDVVDYLRGREASVVGFV